MLAVCRSICSSPALIVFSLVACASVSSSSAIELAQRDAELAAKNCLDEIRMHAWIDTREVPVDRLDFLVGTHPEMHFWKVTFSDGRDVLPDHGDFYLCLSDKHTLLPARIEYHSAHGMSIVEFVRPVEWAEDGYYNYEQLERFTLDSAATWFVGNLGRLLLDVHEHTQEQP